MNTELIDRIKLVLLDEKEDISPKVRSILLDTLTELSYDPPTRPIILPYYPTYPMVPYEPYKITWGTATSKIVTG